MIRVLLIIFYMGTFYGIGINCGRTYSGHSNPVMIDKTNRKEKNI